jgi:hypothetical protein
MYCGTPYNASRKNINTAWELKELLTFPEKFLQCIVMF